MLIMMPIDGDVMVLTDGAGAGASANANDLNNDNNGDTDEVRQCDQW